MILNLFWKPFAWLVSQPFIVDYLLNRAKKTPYFNLEGYMNRWWLFNRYDDKPKESRWLPSIRIHHILREDIGRHKHDHPWDARTILLRGWYREERLLDSGEIKEYHRKAGDTATLNYGEYHDITEVSEGGVLTMFITYKYRGTWGFLVDGVKIPHDEYEEFLKIQQFFKVEN